MFTIYALTMGTEKNPGDAFLESLGIKGFSQQASILLLCANVLNVYLPYLYCVADSVPLRLILLCFYRLY